MKPCARACRSSPTALLLVCLLLGASPSPAQSGFRILGNGNKLLLEDRSSPRRFAFEMWNTRLANALFDERFTRRVIACLDDYLRYGVNTIAVSIQGGEMGPNRNHLHPAAYHADGTLQLKSVIWPNLRRLLAETDSRGMVLILMYWYHRRHLEVPEDAAALQATRNVTRWLKSTGHRNYILNIVNEFDHYSYMNPATRKKRPLFTTLPGALQLLNAVREEDPELLAGLSPVNGLLCPEGFLDILTRESWVEADIIFGHGPIIDPENKAGYRVGPAPMNPLSRVYINDEFFYQLRYETRLQKDPGTGRWTYGHWDRDTVERYIADIHKLLAFGGYANVFSHRQQYIGPETEMPVPEVGPAGTQPELMPGGGEPSMHWLFRAIADIRKTGGVPARLDFNHGHGCGLDHTLAGTWSCVNGRLHQTDEKAAPAFARIAADEGEIEIAFTLSFLSDPGKEGRAGIQVGAAGIGGPAFRLLIGKDSVTLDQAGVPLSARTVKVLKRTDDDYLLRLLDDRVIVEANGVNLIEVPGARPVLGQNLLLVTQQAQAAFDNVRIGPMRWTDFDDGGTAPWTAVDPSSWRVIAGPGGPPNREWEATVPKTKTRHAVLDKLFEDFTFRCDLNLTQAAMAAIRFRTADTSTPWSPGYTVFLTQRGEVTLERIPPLGPAIRLGAATVSINPDAVTLWTAMEGGRIVIRVDGKTVLDLVDANDPPDRGSLQLLAFAGKVRFDNLHLEAGANRFPHPRIWSPGGPPLPAGFFIEYTDPDGILDLTGIQLEGSLDGRNFLDFTLLLHPFFGLFTLVHTPDGKGYRFTLANPLPMGPGWTVRATARDRKGNTTALVFKTGNGVTKGRDSRKKRPDR